jgi:glycosyltransferase involved in cell wall biosynthesis
LARQRFADFEAVIVDDASTDGTADEIGAVIDALGDRRFRLQRQLCNRGLTRCLIEAIAKSDASYVAIQDAGDISLPDRLYKQVALLDGDPGVAAVGCHYVNVIPERRLQRVRRPDANRATLASMLRDPIFTHGEVTFRRSSYDAVGGYRLEFYYAQDNDLWLRMAREFRFATVPEILYYRIIRLDGLSYNPSSFVRQSAFYLLGRLLAQVPEHEQAFLARLRNGAEIFEIVPLETPALQRLIVRGALRALLFDSPSQTRQLAEGYVMGGLTRKMLLRLADLKGDGAGQHVWRAARRLMRIAPGLPAGLENGALTKSSAFPTLRSQEEDWLRIK